MRLAPAAGAPALFDESFADLPPAPRLPRLLAGLAWAAALVVLVRAGLAALAPDGTPPSALGRAVLVALALPSLVLAVELVSAVPRRCALASALLLAGVVLARPRARTAGAARTTDAARAPGAPGAAGAAGGRVAVGILAVLLAAGELGRQQLDRLRPLLDAERRAADVAVATDVQRTAAAELDAADALTLRGPFRDVRLAARVRLDPDALFEVRLRAPDRRHSHGLALFVPAAGAGRATDGARWMWEDVAIFEPLGPAGAQAPADVWLDLRVEARGRDLVAWWERDGVRHELARGRTLQHPVGDVVLLAAGERVGLRDLVVEPLHAAGSAAGAVPWADVAASLAPLLLLVVLWLAVAPILLGVAPSLALQAGGLALLPLAAVLRWQDESAVLSPDLVAAAAVAAGVWLLVHGSVHSTGAGRGRRLAIGLAAVLACCLVFGAAVERPLPRDPAHANFLGWTAGGGTRVDWGRPHLEHPYVRRWNHYLAEHRLRGRRVALDKPAGTRRVVCLGGSSTWGYRLPAASDLDYPSRLQERLGRAAAWRADGAPSAVDPPTVAPPAVEVLNAAVLATTLARQYVFLRDALLELQPDVVVASFFYNDAFALSRSDELDRLLAPGVHRDGPLPWRLPWPLGPLLSAEARENLAGHRRLRRLMGDFARGGAPSHDARPAGAGRPPPESF
jgi:hypothetical protein